MTKEQHDDSIVLTEPEAETTPASSDKNKAVVVGLRSRKKSIHSLMC